jgi:hypothetical protein
MGTTSNRGYRYPASTDNVQIWTQIQNAATDVDTDVKPLYDARGAWASYTPVWNGTGQSLGNGTIAGAYITQGKTCSFTLELTWGSTTAAGTSAWLFNLPGAASGTSPGYSFCAHLIDSSTSTHRVVMAKLDNANRVILYLDGASSAIPGASGTSPWTWATGDIVRVTGTYQLA